MANETGKKYNMLFTGKMSTSTMLTLYTLYLLRTGERMCGKDICNAIYQRFNYSWTPSHGMIYPILRDMEKEGLVKASWMDADRKTKRLYWITDEGKDTLEKEIENNEGVIKEAVSVMVTLMNDLFKARDLPRLSDEQHKAM